MKTETYCEELFGMSYEQAERYYLDYVNNYLTVSHFAESNNIPAFFAEKIINIGREYNHNRPRKTEAFDYTVNIDR